MSTPTYTSTNTATVTFTATDTNTPTITNSPIPTSTPTVTPTFVSFATLYADYINVPIGSSQKCSSCHGPGENGNFNPSSAANFYNTVVNGAAVHGCGSTLVTPGDANTSVLYLRLTGSCPAQMPEGGPTFLTTAQLAEFAAWINEGAPDN
jgi:hypothetical protein